LIKDKINIFLSIVVETSEGLKGDMLTTIPFCYIIYFILATLTFQQCLQVSFCCSY